MKTINTKLPPLRGSFARDFHCEGQVVSVKEAQDYAKLTARQALERAKQKFLVENNFPQNTIRTNTAHDCAKVVDAILEEYK